MSSEDEDQNNMSEVIADADEDTIRILLSTDNHLGYCEGDPVRGNDSFAALEEVLYLAKHYQADLVLLAGDLFHHNKPSRRTLYKTMEIFRRYCMGPNPIQIQILNDDSMSSKNNFRQGVANYQNENYSVDLPVFSIHGNHDDPTREGTELYAALDLLDCANLVNYVGRQEQVNQIQVSPILMKKGTTHLALYGLGSMRDERLNRMWQGQKLTFLRPEADDREWFQLFALHQNRDLGRGTKNCVHESMIPEWMDLVCWGHEHECCIEPQESVVGTFRITQPGSSVATSLTAGESRRKHVGILDIRGQSFRLKPIPLTQVRTFVLGDLSLQQQRRLDPEDPKVEQKVSQVLQDQVRVLIHDAREKHQELREAAKQGGNVLACMDELPLKNILEKPDEVLVRLKVEHSGFSTLNNQRFGAKFIGEVANPVRRVG
jgi:double-strand break repair protein MRE11